MASAINPITSSSNAGTGATAPASNLSSPPSEQMFLTLLVSQLKNQDPLNPTDSTQFVSQLAQFSQLEQVIGIRQDIEKGQQAAAGGTTATGQSS